MSGWISLESLKNLSEQRGSSRPANLGDRPGLIEIDRLALEKRDDTD